MNLPEERLILVTDCGLAGLDGCYRRRDSVRWYYRGMEGNCRR